MSAPASSPPPEQTLYELLGLPTTATSEEINKRYKKLALEHHPDRHRHKKPAQDVVDQEGGNSTHQQHEMHLQNQEEKFQKISHAHKILCNLEKRADYDAKYNFNFGMRAMAAIRPTTEIKLARLNGGVGKSRNSNVSRSRSGSGSSGNEEDEDEDEDYEPEQFQGTSIDVLLQEQALLQQQQELEIAQLRKKQKAGKKRKNKMMRNGGNVSSEEEPSSAFEEGEEEAEEESQLGTDEKHHHHRVIEIGDIVTYHLNRGTHTEPWGLALDKTSLEVLRTGFAAAVAEIPIRAKILCIDNEPIASIQDFFRVAGSLTSMNVTVKIGAMPKIKEEEQKQPDHHLEGEDTTNNSPLSTTGQQQQNVKTESRRGRKKCVQKWRSKDKKQANNNKPIGFTAPMTTMTAAVHVDLEEKNEAESLADNDNHGKKRGSGKETST